MYNACTNLGIKLYCTTLHYIILYSEQLSSTVHIHVDLMLIASFLHTDIDECRNWGCQYKCMNTPGSFECVCSKGMFKPSIGIYCRGECAESSTVLCIAVFFHCLTTYYVVMP